MRVPCKWSKYSASLLTAIVLMASAPVAANEDATSSEWKKTFEVYGWLPNIYITTPQQDHITLTLGDLISNLKFLTMLDFGVQKDKWSMGADVLYMHIEGSGETIKRGPIENPIDVDVSVGIRAFISTFGGGYQFFNDNGHELHGVFGARYLYLKVPIEIDLDVEIGPEEGGKVTLGGQNWDGIVGLRGKKEINDRWYANYYADVGTGESDLTWQAKVGFGYHFNKFTGTFGFRYLRWNFDSSSELDNLRVIGPYLGARWTW